jgi:hypothetical protein
VPGSISSEHVQAGTQANISGRESAKEAAIGARQQEAEKAKIEAELVKTDSGISQLTVQQMQLNKALAKNDGARVTVPDAKGKPTVVTLTPDTRVELASQRDILHQQRTDAVARRNARASAVGWAPHQATDANLQPAGAAAAPAAAAPAAAAPAAAAPAAAAPAASAAAPSAIATPKPGTIITFNGKKGLWTGTGFTAIK